MKSELVLEFAESHFVTLCATSITGHRHQDDVRSTRCRTHDTMSADETSWLPPLIPPTRCHGEHYTVTALADRVWHERCNRSSV